MKRISCNIEEDTSNIINDEDEDMDFESIRVIRSMERRVDGFLADWLDSWIAWEDWSRRWSFDDDDFFSCEVFTPGDACEGVMESIEIGDFLFWDFDINPVCETTPNKESIECFKISCSWDETVLSSGFRESEFFTFSANEGFESWLAGEGNMKLVFIKRSRFDDFCFSDRTCSFFMRDDFHEWEYREKLSNVKEIREILTK